MFKKFSKNNKGFTLLEMIVSLGIFSVVAVIAVSSLVRITSLNRQTQYLQSAMNNINYVLDMMSREMRYGTDFHCEEGYNTWNSAVVSTQSTFSVTADKLKNMQPRECLGINAGTIGKGFALYFRSNERSSVGNNYAPCNLVVAYFLTNESIRRSKQDNCDVGATFTSQPHTNRFRTLTGYKENYLDVGKSFFVVYPGANNYSYVGINLVGYVWNPYNTYGRKESERQIFNIRTGVAQSISDI